MLINPIADLNKVTLILILFKIKDFHIFQGLILVLDHNKRNNSFAQQSRKLQIDFIDLNQGYNYPFLLQLCGYFYRFVEFFSLLSIRSDLDIQGAAGH